MRNTRRIFIIIVDVYYRTEFRSLGSRLPLDILLRMKVKGPSRDISADRAVSMIVYTLCVFLEDSDTYLKITTIQV